MDPRAYLGLSQEGSWEMCCRFSKGCFMKNLKLGVCLFVGTLKTKAKKKH